ncbi:hypothetical protein VDIAB_100303 [Vibrio diabolicus]|nr:hypothetical protein VDIAB_100303 [Vibrio diabolicus]
MLPKINRIVLLNLLFIGKIMSSKRTGRQRHWYQLLNKDKITKKQENKC